VKMSVGVGWAVHCCLNLALLGDEATVPPARLAALSELPAAYLTKHMQAPARESFTPYLAPKAGSGWRATAPGSSTPRCAAA
jgi:hypothetical protein